MLLYKNRLKGGGGVWLNVSRARDPVGIYLINTQRLPSLGQQKVQ